MNLKHMSLRQHSLFVFYSFLLFFLFSSYFTLPSLFSGERAAMYGISADIESMTWDPFCPFHLYCSLENGEIVCIDIRIPRVPLCAFQAHAKTTSGISFSSGIPGLMASSSIDKTVKLWDVSNIHKIDPSPYSGGLTGGNQGSIVPGLEPHLVMYKSMNVGKLFALQYYSDDPYVLATAGDKGSVAVWECDEAETVKNHFQDRAVKTSEGVYASLINSTSTASASVPKNVPSVNVSTTATSGSISAALALPGHKLTVEPVVQDDSWMDEPEPDKSTVKIGKKTKKIKKDGDKVKKDKK